MNPTSFQDAYGILFVSIALLYLCGSWIWLVFQQECESLGGLLVQPSAGLISFVTIVSLASYAGIPVAKACVPVVVLHSCVALWAAKRGSMSKDQRLLAPFAVFAAIAASIFLLPYAQDGAFYVFGDSFTYITIADFVRDHGYSTPTSNLDKFPWQSHMEMYRVNHFRMGSQYFLSSITALLGVSSDRAYMPTTGTFLFVCFLAFAAFLRGMGARHSAIWASVVPYSVNIFAVLAPAAANFMPQIPGLACLMLLFAVPHKSTNWRTSALRGVFGAGILLFYPEIAIFAASGVGLMLAVTALSRDGTWPESIRSAAITILASVVVNPIAAYHSVMGLVSHSQGRSGFDVVLSVPGLMRSLVSMQSIVEQPLWLTIMGTSLGIAGLLIGVWGIARSDPDTRNRWLCYWGLFACVGLYTYFISNYSYASYKVVVYSQFLMAAAIGIGIGRIWDWGAKKGLRVTGLLVIAAFWTGGVSSLLANFLTSHYDMVRHPIFAHPKGLGGFSQNYVALAAVSKIPAADEETVVFIPSRPEARWAMYYFRSPADLFFREGVTLSGPSKTPAHTSHRFALVERAATTMRESDAVIYKNERFAFTKAQTIICLTNQGWYDEEIFAGEPRRWMANQADAVAWVPSAERIRLRAKINNPTYPQPRTLRLLLDGKLIGRHPLTTPDSAFDSGEFDLPSGVHQIRFETEEKAVGSATGDTRILNLLWTKLQIADPAPSKIVLRETDADAQIKGASSDRWMMDKPLELTLSVAPGSKVLRVAGDVPGIAAILPQSLIVTFNDSKPIVIGIPHTGPFQIDVPVPAAIDGTVGITLRAGKTFSPALVSANPDTRLLGIRLRSVEVLR